MCILTLHDCACLWSQLVPNHRNNLNAMATYSSNGSRPCCPLPQWKVFETTHKDDLEMDTQLGDKGQNVVWELCHEKWEWMFSWPSSSLCPLSWRDSKISGCVGEVGTSRTHTCTAWLKSSSNSFSPPTSLAWWQSRRAQEWNFREVQIMNEKPGGVGGEKMETGIRLRQSTRITHRLWEQVTCRSDGLPKRKKKAWPVLLIFTQVLPG